MMTHSKQKMKGQALKLFFIYKNNFAITLNHLQILLNNFHL